MVFALITMALGVLVIFLHFKAAELIMVLCGISLILDSVTDFIIVSAWRARQRAARKLEQ